MTRTLLRRATFLLVAVAFFGCRDQTPDLLAPGAISRTHLPSDAAIKALILEVFSGGIRQSTTNHWDHVLSKLEGGDAAGARTQLIHTVSFIQKHTDDITPPAGETQEQVASRLILYMTTYVYQGPSAVPTVGNDFVVGVILPTQAAVIVTPEGKAGISLPAGAVSEPTILFIYRDAQQSRTSCTGPLDTGLCQYPLFYHFDPYPHQRLNLPARVGVCHITSGPGAPDPDDEELDDRLRVAHEAPAEAAGYVPGGSLTDGIEILPLVDVSGFLTCGQTSVASASTMGRGGNSLADRGRRMLNRLASAAVSVATPKIAHAVDQGGGGETLEFSNFLVVDPRPRPTDTEPVDATPPVITPTITGTEGLNGWYTSNVKVSWYVTDGESAVTSDPCTTALIDYDTAEETVTCTATSAGGTDEESVTVKRDATPPIVSYTGNQETYLVNETVAITCTPFDATSKLASHTCANISGEAYTFGLGPEPYSATATDNAGNTTTVSKSFEVLVTPASLCTLTQKFSSSAGIGNSLCAKLNAYAASILRGNLASAAGQRRAYINEVRAQSGKAITSVKAELLIGFALAL